MLAKSRGHQTPDVCFRKQSKMGEGGGVEGSLDDATQQQKKNFGSGYFFSSRCFESRVHPHSNTAASSCWQTRNEEVKCLVIACVSVQFARRK